MKKEQIVPKKSTEDQVSDLMKGLASGIGEEASNKIADYVSRINAGEKKEKVLEGLPPSFIDGVNKLLSAQKKEEDELIKKEKSLSKKDERKQRGGKGGTLAEALENLSDEQPKKSEEETKNHTLKKTKVNMEDSKYPTLNDYGEEKDTERKTQIINEINDKFPKLKEIENIEADTVKLITKSGKSIDVEKGGNQDLLIKETKDLEIKSDKENKNEVPEGMVRLTKKDGKTIDVKKAEVNSLQADDSKNQNIKSDKENKNEVPEGMVRLTKKDGKTIDVKKAEVKNLQNNEIKDVEINKEEYFKAQADKKISTDRLKDAEKRVVEIADRLRSRRIDAIEENAELLKEIDSIKKRLEKIEKEFPDLEKIVNETNKEQEQEQIIQEKVDIEEKIKNELNNILDKKDEAKDVALIKSKLQINGLSEKTFEKIPAWKSLSTAEKLFVFEQMSQEMLSKVKEIGEQRFQEKNKLNLSFNPSKWSFSLGKKIFNNVTKQFWISKEEKNVIEEAENGRLNPDPKTLRELVERTADMHLNIVQKDGRSFIEFLPLNKDLTTEQQKTIEDYNKAANEFARMPDAWRNEKAANGRDSRFFKKNYENYEKVRVLYENSKSNLIKSQVENYLKNGDDLTTAQKKAMQGISEEDYKISILQFTNTNPDAVKELSVIKNESSWGRLVNNENIWRGLYIGTGWMARSATAATIGLLAAPLVSSVIGGARARRKAEGKIDLAFNEGRKMETFIERKDAGKTGLYDDKNAKIGLISRTLKTLNGDNVNAKEVGAFIDADSQTKRLDNLIQKIEAAKNNREKIILKDQLLARIDYIENKNEQGLINYGEKNAISLNYELFKKLSFAQAQLSCLDFIGNSETEGLNAKRETLLWEVIQKNNEQLDKKQANFKNNEMVRGAIVAAGFSLLGWKIRDLIHGGIDHGINTNEINQNEINEHLTVASPKIAPSELKNVNVEFSSKGAIKTIEILKDKINTDYPDISKAPKNIQEFMKTNSTQEAIKLGFYNPNDPSGAESAIISKGSTLGFDSNGNLVYHDINTGENQDLIISQNKIETIEKYQGKMFDSDNSAIKNETIINTPHINNSDDIDQELLKRQVAPGENPANSVSPNKIIDTPHISSPNDIDQELLKRQVAPGGIQASKVSPEEILNSSEGAEAVAPEKIKEIYRETISHLFPGEKGMKLWDNVRNLPASVSMGVTVEDAGDTGYGSFIHEMHELQRVTGLNPMERSLISEPETNEQFIIRAQKEALKMNKLEEISQNN